MSEVNEIMNRVLIFVEGNLRWFALGLGLLGVAQLVFDICLVGNLRKVRTVVEMLEMKLKVESEIIDKIARGVDNLEDKHAATLFKVKNLYHDRDDFSDRLRQLEVSLYDLKEDDGK